MGEPKRIAVSVLKGEAPILMARVDDWDATALVKADISTITYTIYAIGRSYPAERTAVTGHSAQSVTVATSMYDTLQTDARWTADATGYNFRHQPSMSTNNAFQTVGDEQYIVAYTFTPTSGQAILLEFIISVR